MIDYLRGRLAALSPGKATLEINGIGLQLSLPSTAHLTDNILGQEITVYCRLIVREEELLLYGFSSPLERNLFNQVISVTGFGPRLALALLGVLTVTEFYLAVIEENIAMLCRAPGVGRKIAQRLVLELKEKLPELMASAGPISTAAPESSVDQDIMEALSTLGYPAGQAAAATKLLTGEQRAALTREELLKLVLKKLAR